MNSFCSGTQVVRCILQVCGTVTQKMHFGAEEKLGQTVSQLSCTTERNNEETRKAPVPLQVHSELDTVTNIIWNTQKALKFTTQLRMLVHFFYILIASTQVSVFLSDSERYTQSERADIMKRLHYVWRVSKYFKDEYIQLNFIMKKKTTTNKNCDRKHKRQRQRNKIR